MSPGSRPPPQPPTSPDVSVGAPKVSAARERILRTAHDLFYRDGIRATGIDRVIADAGVTKVTFYRHFPGKHALVRAFLERRHHEWLQAFESALADHGDRLEALPAVLATWFASPTFRGCAFINSVAELGGELPDVTDIARRHKDELVQRLARRLPSRPPAEALALASALGLAIDGAIVRATLDGDARPACQALGSVVMALLGRPPEAAGETAVPAVD